jgi:SAM-dependent methyltransferase
MTTSHAQQWIERWDRMQERYLVARAERFDRMVRIVRAIQADPKTILDLGCGTGSVSFRMAEAFPNCRIVSVDMDFTLLPLARSRCAGMEDRVSFVEVDLRSPSWVEQVPRDCSAVVSATALHWFNPSQLRTLYFALPQVMAPGALLVNADHVGSDAGGIQRMWEESRDRMRLLSDSRGEDWSGFWREYLAELGPEVSQRRQEVLRPWQGIESGLPLWWHLNVLQEAGFEGVDCFWRLDCDVIYGGIKKAEEPAVQAG